MKVCLVRPPIAIPSQNMTAMLTPPLGLAYVGAALREAGHEVTFFDASGEAPDIRHPLGDDTFVVGLNLE